MSFIENLCSFIDKKICDYAFYDIDDKIEQLDKSSIYPISEYQAFQIANQNRNLKTDYKKNSGKYIVDLDFSDFKIKLVDGDNKQKYWLVKITEGDFTEAPPFHDYDADDRMLFYTTVSRRGYFDKKDLKKLQCLIDVNTGEYIYYPKT